MTVTKSLLQRSNFEKRRPQVLEKTLIDGQKISIETLKRFLDMSPEELAFLVNDYYIYLMREAVSNELVELAKNSYSRDDAFDSIFQFSRAVLLSF
jgi:hypothetical protein